MGTQIRRQLPDIIQDLVDNPSQYGFYQALRLLEQAWTDHGCLTDELDKWVKLIPAPEISFPASDFRRCEYDDKFRIILECNFMGLYGVDAPVPHYISEVTARDDERSEIFRNFLNIFSHRFYSLFYKVWKKYNPVAYLEHDGGQYRNYLSAIAGRAAEPVGGEELAYAGVLGGRNSNAEGLKGILREFLKVDVIDIQQFVPRWVTLDAVPSLGTTAYGGLVLSENTVIGKRVLDLCGKIQVRIGPLPMQEVLKLLPQRKTGSELGTLIVRYLSPTIDYDILLIVIPDKNWRMCLGISEANLGWTTLLGEFNGDHYTIKIPGKLYKKDAGKKIVKVNQTVKTKEIIQAEIA